MESRKIRKTVKFRRGTNKHEKFKSLSKDKGNEYLEYRTIPIRCDICFEDNQDLLVIDHCHVTGKARGILCRNCNTLLGMAEDDEEILLSAMSYLRESRDDEYYEVKTERNGKIVSF